TYFIIWKLCNGAGGYAPGVLTVYKKKFIDKDTWLEFKSKVDQIDFWNLKKRDSFIGLDGSYWILEGKIPTQYNVADRWSPNNDGTFYQCCDYLIGLTDLKIENNKKY
ncbi:MAG: hypothetical protein V2A54_12380, partial [Bacteroidota bacterium]